MATLSQGEVIKLDEGQEYALQAFRSGKSVALIGGAGCGKSFLLRRLITEAEALRGGFPKVVACALSNKVASAINGVTMHSLFGAKASWEFSKEHLWNQLKHKTMVRDRLEKIEVLIFDEVSVIRSNEIDAIDYVLRKLGKSEWHSSLPFGGRIVIASGDPFQLEPHEEKGTLQVEAGHTFFQSRAWYLTFGPPGDGVIAVLKRNHRQIEDSRFFNLLNRIRTGYHSLEDVEELNHTSGGSADPPGVCTYLFATRREVRRMNESILRKLEGFMFKFRANDTYFVNRSKTLEYRVANVAPREVSIKVGAFVILTRKCEGVIPGSQGVILAIRNETKHRQFPRFGIDIRLSSHSERSDGSRDTERVITVGLTNFDVHGYDCTIQATRQQIPLIPGYAMTVHRSQGMTMRHVAIDFKTADEWSPCGLVYVALSRCTTMSGLWVKNLDNRHIRVSHKAKALMWEIHTLWTNIPSRVSGVENFKCIGILSMDGDTDMCTVESDERGDSDDEESVIDLVNVTNTGSSLFSVPSAQSVIRGDILKVGQRKRRRSFVWERKNNCVESGRGQNVFVWAKKIRPDGDVAQFR